MAHLPTSVEDAQLSGADLSGADLRRTRITQDQLNSAKGDHTTKIPEGPTRPTHW